MISVSNCEIGIRRLKQIPSVFRAICCNGCIWDQNFGSNINKIHLGDVDLHELSKQIALNIHEQIPLLSEGIKRFLATKDRKIAKEIPLSKVFAQIGIENNLTNGMQGQITKIADMFCNHEADNRNAFGVINAITRAGQFYSPSDWVKFDSVAGQIMTMNDNHWESFLARANAMNEKVYNKAYGVVAA
jgi:hypothetical protein